MITKIFKDIIDRVDTWPAERQEAAARVLMDMESQSAATYRLSDKQVAEVEQRRKNPDRKFLTLEEVREHFAKRRA